MDASETGFRGVYGTAKFSTNPQSRNKAAAQLYGRLKQICDQNGQLRAAKKKQQQQRQLQTTGNSKQPAHIIKQSHFV